jgi:hypothetical protein
MSEKNRGKQDNLSCFPTATDRSGMVQAKLIGGVSQTALLIDALFCETENKF